MCRPISQDGLGIHHIQHTNAALLAKRVLQVIQPSGDILSLLLRQVYGHSMDKETWPTPRRGDSPYALSFCVGRCFMAGLREYFTHMQPSFCPQLGDGTRFKFWQEDWSGLGQLRNLFPRLYALAPVLGVTVQTQWSDAWCPTIPQALSDQRLADLLILQSWLASMRLTDRIRDAWIWRYSRFSVRAAYHILCGQEPPKDPPLIRQCQLVWKQRLLLKIRLFGWLLL